MQDRWASLPGVTDLGRGIAQGARTQLSRDLVALWADEYGPALALLRRTLPAGLMRYLGQPRPRPAPAPRLREPPADALPAGPERALSPPPRVRPARLPGRASLAACC
jgi:hypothetical protein